jgi:hypothetical protein
MRTRRRWLVCMKSSVILLLLNFFWGEIEKNEPLNIHYSKEQLQIKGFLSHSRLAKLESFHTFLHPRRGTKPKVIIHLIPSSIHHL